MAPARRKTTSSRTSSSPQPHSYLLVFSTRGRVYWLKVHELPQAGRAAKGRPIINLVKFQHDEKLAALMAVRKFEEGKFVVMVTRLGVIKKTSLEQFSNPRPSGILALGIDDGDALVAARLTEGSRDILLSTSQGMAIRFPEDDVRAMGRTAYGVKGITLEAGDAVVGADIIEPGTTVLSVTENGYGKRTEDSEYKSQGRGGKGIITMKTSERNGSVVGVVQVKETDGVMVITNQGMLIRLAAKGISVIGRNTQGVRLISLESADEKVVGVVRVVADETPEGGEPPPEGGSDAGASGEPDGEASNGSDESSDGNPSASGDA